MSEKIFKPEKKPAIEDAFSDLEFLLNFDSAQGNLLDYEAKIGNALRIIAKQVKTASSEDQSKSLDVAFDFFYPNNPPKIIKEVIGIYSQLDDLAIKKISEKIITAQKERLYDENDAWTPAGEQLWRITFLNKGLTDKLDSEKMKPLIKQYINLLLIIEGREKLTNVPLELQAISDVIAGFGDQSVGELLDALKKYENTTEENRKYISVLLIPLKQILSFTDTKKETRIEAIKPLIQLLNKPDRRCTFTLEVEDCLSHIGESALSPLLAEMKVTQEEYISRYHGVFKKMVNLIPPEKIEKILSSLEILLQRKDFDLHTIQRIKDAIEEIKEYAEDKKKKAA